MDLQSSKDDKQKDQFILVSTNELPSVTKLLQQRLPQSTSVYNSAVHLSRHPDEFLLYALKTVNGKNSSPNELTWFIVVQIAQDYGQIISISAPNENILQITPEIKHALIETNIFDWHKPYFFCGIERTITPLIMEISTIIKGNSTLCNPLLNYTMDHQDALVLQIETPKAADAGNAAGPAVVVQSLDDKFNLGAEFLTNMWKYKKEGTIENVKTLIEHNPSCGIYINGKPVCGILTHRNYAFGMLATDKAHRGKGYATICMKNLIKSFYQNGFVPTSKVEENNLVANAFHIKVGMKFTHKCDDVSYFGSHW